MATDRWDVLVVGAGPAGAAAGYWLSQRGHRVLIVERKRFPREKTCGDGLTPRAVRQLEDMGLGEQLADRQRFEGLRSIAHGVTLELEWPEHPDFPSYGYVVRRRDLDEMVAERAVKAGATLWTGAEAVAPLHDADGRRVVGAVVRHHDHDSERPSGRGTGIPDRSERDHDSERPSGRGTGIPDRSERDHEEEPVNARYVVVADGSNSRFGRALGATRNRRYPLGMAVRGYFESPYHDERWIESHLDLRDRHGQHLPGYGWIFPVGDGTVNVGVGLLSTFAGWKDVNTTHLMDAFCETAPARWGISPATACGAPTGGKLPTGFSVQPAAGPGWLLVGDAAGSVNPFNGEGISVAYETGRIAAGVLDRALTHDQHATGGEAALLARYPQLLDERYGLYFKVARLFVAAIGNPAVMRELTRLGFRSRTLMEWVLRIMANLLRADERGPAELAYRAVARVVAAVPRA